MRPHALRALVPALFLAAAACSDSPLAPTLDDAPAPFFDHATDPDPGGTHTYTFDTCDPEDLVFTGTIFSLICDGGAFNLGPGGQEVILPEPALSVEISATPTFGEALTLTAWSDDVEVGTDTGDPNVPGVLSVAATDLPITRIVLGGPGSFDDLTVAYGTPEGGDGGDDGEGGGETPADPADKAACKDGGWEAFGFRNQGQCVRFVETGEDSR